jgi:large subunit ribosomal protein L19
MVVAIAQKGISPVNMEERKNLDIRAGDVVRVHQKIQEKGKVRLQVFEGLVLSRKHGTEAGATFTVRATLSGVGVEKIFPLYSPMIDKIEIVRRSKVRRAKLYYIKEKASREQRRQLRKMSLVSLSTTSDRETAEADAKAKENEATAEATSEEAKETA